MSYYEEAGFYRCGCCDHHPVHSPPVRSTIRGVRAAIIDHQIAHHTDAIIVCGTTGEGLRPAPTRSTRERSGLVLRVRQRPCSRSSPAPAPIDTDYAIELTKFASLNAARTDCLSVTPYYNKTTQHGLIAHYHRDCRLL